MSESDIEVKVSCNIKPFKEFARDVMLTVYRLLGWRRFFLLDWWKVKLGFL